MELTTKQQAVELIKNSHKILLLTPNFDGDSIGSMVALNIILKELGKDVLMVCPEEVPNKFSFLSHLEDVKKDLSEIRNFIISLNLDKSSVSKLGYKIENNKLNITVTPKTGTFSYSDIATSQGAADLDLIIIFDTADLDMLGKLYDENTELFYKTPVLNIDHHASNDYFGKVNLIDLTATSTCEILVSIFESLSEGLNKPLITDDVATALLTGLITDTSSFQNQNTTPKSMTVSAQLIAQGAKQQEIINNVYKAKSLSTLRLWGRILAQIREDKEYKIVWSLVSLRDLEQTSSTVEETSGIMNELLMTAGSADVIVLLTEKENGVDGSIRTSQGIDAIEIARMFGGGGHPQAAGFQIMNIGLAEAEREVINKIREMQKKRLGIM
jgi:phosphoesterase RecJ-like protein